MTLRPLVLHLLIVLAVAGCERTRKTPDVVQTGHSATAVAPHATLDTAHPSSAKAPEPRVVRDWETWIPQWQVALRDPDTLAVEVMSPLRSCAPGSNEPPDVGRRSDWRPKLRVQVTQASFDAIAAAYGFVRQGKGWITVAGADTLAASVDSASGWRILRGGLYGKPIQTAPAAGRPTTSADSNTLRHSGMIAARRHPAGCTLVLAYLPNEDGGDDTAAVQRVLESVTVGGDLPPGFASLRDGPDTVTVTPPNPADTIPEANDPGFGIIGVVDSGSVTDTVRIHASPDAASRVVARFFHSPDSGYKVVAHDSVEPSFSEYAYEEEALAALEANRDTSWVRVRYGMRGDTALTGWTRPIEGHVFLESWVNLIFGRGAAVGSPNYVVFLASPDGRVLPRGMVEGEGSAALYPFALKGPWMMVRVVTPSEECDIQAEHSRETYAWVRLLTNRDRPYFAYSPRGC